MSESDQGIKPGLVKQIQAWIEAFKSTPSEARRLCHLCLLLALTLVAVTARFVFVDHYKRDSREVERRARDNRTRDLVAMWDKMKFSSGKQLPADFVARVDWGSLKLDDEQRLAATNTIRDVVAYLQGPSFREYYRLKTGRRHYHFALSPRAARLLGHLISQRALTAPAETALADIWEANDAAAPKARLTSICLDTIIAKATSTKLYSTGLSKSFTIAYEALNPGFQYGAAKRQNPAKNKLIVDFIFFARSSISTEPGPVQVSLVWSEIDRTWILNEMLSDIHLRLNTML